MKRRIRVLNPMSAWGGGHIQTCINIVKGMYRAGADVHLHAVRSNVDMTDVPYSPTVPRFLIKPALERREVVRRARTEKRFLSQLTKEDIVWLWPMVSIETYREVSRRGHPILMEGINTRSASARRILDRVYEAAGRPEGAGISDAKIANEEEMLSLATHFFAPNAKVEAALMEPDSSFRGQILKSSYGTWMPSESQWMPPLTEPDHVMTVLAVGTVCLRKNSHGLLRAWKRLAPSNAKLVLCGGMTSDIARLCAEELKLPSVEVRGHVSDIDSVYRAADIFVMPSFEEGGPQVTYEAAGHGVALIASPMGAGRIQDHEGAVLLIDPDDPDDIAAKIKLLLQNASLRKKYAQTAHAVAPLYDWNAVGRARYAALKEVFGDV